MSDITKRYGIITGGTGSFGSVQHTDGSDMGTRVEIFDSSKNLKNITSVSASGDVQGGAGTFGGNVSVGGNLTVNGTTTSVNSTSIELGDRIINLNSSNAAGDAGFYVNDTATDQTGSMLWDSSTDRWMAGLSGSEVILVDRSSTETLTNKTLTSPVISSGDINSPDIDGGTIDGTVIGANSAAAGTFAAVTATTMAATSLSASSFVSGSSFEVDGQASIKYQSSALDFSNGSAGAALSTSHFSSSVELQGPTLEVSGAAQVGSLTINGTALTATAAEINYLDNDDLTAADITKLAALTATAAELNYLDNSDLTSADIQKLADITATAAEINDLTSNAVDSSDFTKLSEVTATSTELNYVDVTAGTATASKAVVLDASKNIATIGTVGCGAITSTGASEFATVQVNSNIIRDSGGNPQFQFTEGVGYTAAKGTFTAGVYSTSLSGSTTLSVGGDATLGGNIRVNGNYIKDSGGNNAIFLQEGVGISAQRGSFSGGVLTTTVSGSGAAEFASLHSDSVNVDGGNIDGTIIGASSVAAGSFAALAATTVSGSSSGSFASLSLDSGTAMTSIKDEDNMGSDSATALATQQSIKAYVDAQVTAQDLDFQGDVGGALNIDLDSETLDIAGGTNISTSGSGNTLTVNLDSALSSLTSVDGSGDLTMGTITMTGFSVDADGDTSVKSLASTAGITATTVSGSDAAQFASMHSDSVNIDGGAIDGTVIGASSAAAGTFAALAGTTGTFSGVLKSDDTTEATSTTDGSLQTDGGLSVAKSAVVGDDLDLLSDSAILNFGADKDVNLTHVADTGLLLNSSMQLQFGDSGTYIHQSADGVLDLVADSEIEINATNIDVNGAADFSGDATFGASIKFGMGSDHYITNKSSDNNLLLESMSAGVTAGGWFKVTGDLTVTGNDIKDASNSAAITFDGSTNTTINGTLGASGHITLASGKDLLAADATCEIGSSGTKFAAVYATNVYTGDMHLKNERGDWTIFEESDHLRIRNNLTGQTFKMGMTLIDDQ